MARKIGRFGELLSEGIVSVAKRKGKKIAQIERALARELDFTYHTIQRWRRGYVPGELEQIAFLARYCVRNGRLDRTWANSFLTHADYPLRESEALLVELFPSQPKNAELPYLYQNLPPRYGEFLGRQTDMARVIEGLLSRWPLISIEGMAGVGKTTLALEAARHCFTKSETLLDKPFQSVVWISAKDQLERKHWLDEVLDTIARVLNYPYITHLEPEQKRNEVNRLLQAYRVLLIIDNFETVEDTDLERWLLRLPEPSKAILTARHRQIDRLWDVRLEGLDKQEALKLIRHHIRRLGLQDLDKATNDKLLHLADVTGGNPKAIEMALGYIKRGMLSYDEVVDNLCQARETVNDVFDYLFTHSWEFLDKNARHLLMAVAFFTESAGKEALGCVAGLQGYRLDIALGQLNDLSFLSPDTVSSRYSVHPLVRSFSQSQLDKEAIWRQQAEERWIQWFVAFLRQYNTRDWPAHIHLSQEQSNIFTIVSWALLNQHPLAPILVKHIWYYLYIRGLWHECEMFTSQAISQLGDQSNPPLIFWLISHLGWLFHEQDRVEEAIQYLLEAERGILALLQPDLLRETDVLNYLGQLYLFQGKYDLAEDYEVQFMKMAEQTQDQQDIITARYYLALIQLHLGQFPEAERLYLDLITEAKKAAWERAEGYSAYRLAEAQLHLEKIEEANYWLDHARNLAERWQEPLLQAHALYGYARTKKLEGAISDARLFSQQAYDIYYRLGANLRSATEVMSLMREIDEEIEI